MVLAISAFESDPSFRAFQRTRKRSRSVNLLTHALFGWSKNAPQVGSIRSEAHMRRAFNVALVATGVMISVIGSPNRSVAVNGAKGETPNVTVAPIP